VPDARDHDRVAVPTPREVRAAARAGTWQGTTRGSAPGYLQCNLVVLPGEDAERFGRWCDLNASVAPVIARSEAGDPRLPSLGEDVDVRSDLPAYRVFEGGVAVAEVPDLEGFWRDDLVAFAFGCSFSLEDALRLEGVPLRYEERGFGGAIYETTLPTTEHGDFGGPLIVSMRPLPEDAVELAFLVSERYPQLHGRPVHAGDPEALGVNLESPLEALGPPGLIDGEVPVFWACGVTTQTAIERARPRRAYTHVSSQMLVCDVTIEALAGPHEPS
jgi:uncharacterized protein YcsI (UPF0317 family)